MVVGQWLGGLRNVGVWGVSAWVWWECARKVWKSDVEFREGWGSKTERCVVQVSNKEYRGKWEV